MLAGVKELLIINKKSNMQNVTLYLTKDQLNKILIKHNITIDNISKDNDFTITINNIKYNLIYSEGEI